MTDNASLHRDFDTDGDDYDRMVHVRETPHGIFRAVVERDTYAEPPFFDYGCPVFRVTRGYYGGSVLEDGPDYGRESWKHDGLPHDIGEVWERMAALPTPGWTDTIDHVSRYLRIFHGGSAKLVSSSIDRGGDEYLVYDTRAMREHWGQTGERLETSDPDATEWQAFLDGEVYVVSVEKQVTTFMDGDWTDADWDSVGDGPIGGHYGDDWAAEAALDLLDEAIDDTAANMLPLD